MRVLLTRPREDAERLAALLAERGIDSLIEPLIDIVPRSEACPDLDGVQALLVTSANGVRAFAGLTAERRLPLFAVGDATARAAREAGFERVASAGGDVDDLARLVIERLDPKDGALCHVAGSAVAGDLGGRLEAAGFATRRAVLYEARPRRALSPEAAAALTGGALEAVLFFSPRTAASFVTLAQGAGLREACKGLAAFCLSPAVAAAIEDLPWRAVRVAARPTQAALIQLLAGAEHPDDD